METRRGAGSSLEVFLFCEALVLLYRRAGLFGRRTKLFEQTGGESVLISPARNISATAGGDESTVML